jgi:hypothetical protein
VVEVPGEQIHDKREQVILPHLDYMHLFAGQPVHPKQEVQVLVAVLILVKLVELELPLFRYIIMKNFF